MLPLEYMLFSSIYNIFEEKQKTGEVIVPEEAYSISICKKAKNIIAALKLFAVVCEYILSK